MALDLGTFLSDDYKQKVAYLSNHLQRMWTRFNFFVTIESALIGGKFLVNSAVINPGLAITGIVLSLVWYVMGAQDRYLTKLYRWQVEMSAKRLREFFGSGMKSADQATALTDEANKAASLANVSLNNFAEEALSEFVGRVDEALLDEFQKVDEEKLNNKRLPARLLERISSWRAETFSITHLASLIPLLVAALWIVMLIYTLRYQK